MRKAVFILGVLVGCDVGEVPLGGTGVDGGGGVDANLVGAASFQSMVAPIVLARGCTDATQICHTLQAPILSDFSRLAAKYMVKPGETNILVTKGDISVPIGVHPVGSQLEYLTEAEQATVAAWIDSL